MQEEYDFILYSPLERVFERHGVYHFANTMCSSVNDTYRERWFSYFFHSLQEQKNNLRSMFDQESSAITALPDTAKLVMDEVALHGSTTLGDMREKTGLGRHILRRIFDKLVTEDHLTRHGAGPSSRYEA
jgi:hypothetical protein